MTTQQKKPPLGVQPGDGVTEPSTKEPVMPTLHTTPSEIDTDVATFVRRKLLVAETRQTLDDLAWYQWQLAQAAINKFAAEGLPARLVRGHALDDADRDGSPFTLVNQTDSTSYTCLRSVAVGRFGSDKPGRIIEHLWDDEEPDDAIRFEIVGVFVCIASMILDPESGDEFDLIVEVTL